jgi:hypothetical protein
MPPDAITEQAILSVLRQHRGRANAITGNDIAAKLGHRGKYAYRPVQEVIRGLKRQGHQVQREERPGTSLQDCDAGSSPGA